MAFSLKEDNMNWNIQKRCIFSTWWFIQGVLLLYLGREYIELLFPCVLLIIISIAWIFPLHFFIRTLFLILLILYSLLSIGAALLLYLFSNSIHIWTIGVLFIIPILNIIISIIYLIKQRVI